jgi:GT2 family glycosyltransferase
MISIIICSRTNTIKKELKENIEATIGVPYEIILIDNSANKYSICAAYNLGVEQSKYSALCFMHDDIVYHSENWGQRVSDHFADEKTGAIGIAGSPYYPFMPGPWWGSGIIYEYILQSTESNTKPALKNNSGNLKNREVVVFDGAWFCIKKNLFDHIKFDEDNYKGFHLYDADICLQLHEKKFKMYCIADVLIHHSSMGQLNNDWIKGDLSLQKKWANKLPARCIDIKYNQLCRLEYKTLNAFIWVCAANNYTNSKIYAIALKYLLIFKRGYLFYKTPGYLIKFLFKLLFKKGEPFYS